MIFSQQMQTDTNTIDELKKNRSPLQRFRWNFHCCDSQNGREMMLHDCSSVLKTGRSCCDAASGIEERMIGKAGFALPIVALRSN
jgi:hypothetical protein